MNQNSSVAASILQDAAQQSYPVSALYVLATPIGNVCDITLRGLHVLAIADAVACEDTRNTSQLLQRYGLSKQLLATHEHNEREAAAKIIERLQAGQRVALVSDAGTPGGQRRQPQQHQGPDYLGLDPRPGAGRVAADQAGL